MDLGTGELASDPQALVEFRVINPATATTATWRKTPFIILLPG
jgi:hypothetical protein